MSTQAQKSVPQKIFDCKIWAQKIAKNQAFAFEYQEEQLLQILQYCTGKSRYRRVIKDVKDSLQYLRYSRSIRNKLNKIKNDLKQPSYDLRVSNQSVKQSADKIDKIKRIDQQNSQPTHTNTKDFCQLQAQKLSKQHTSVSYYQQDELKQILQFCKGKNQYQKVVKIISQRIQALKPTSSWFNKLPQFVLKILPNQFTCSSQYLALPHQD